MSDLGPLAVHFVDGIAVDSFAWMRAVPRKGDTVALYASNFREDLYEVTQVIWPLRPFSERQVRPETIRVRLRRVEDA